MQKQRMHKKNMPRNRVDALNGIGFLWTLEKKIRKINMEGINTYDELWEFRYNQLVAYKALNGHCNVPCRYPEDPQLGSWVQNQREFRKKRTLSEERGKRLEDLGFLWTISKRQLGKTE